jgi:hypothetical protein
LLPAESHIVCHPQDRDLLPHSKSLLLGKTEMEIVASVVRNAQDNACIRGCVFDGSHDLFRRRRSKHFTAHGCCEHAIAHLFIISLTVDSENATQRRTIPAQHGSCPAPPPEMTVTFEGECVLEYTTLLGASRARWLFRATRLSKPNTTTPSVEWKKCLVLMLTTTTLIWQRRIQWVGTYRKRDSYLTLTYLSGTALSNRLAGLLSMSRLQPVSLCWGIPAMFGIAVDPAQRASCFATHPPAMLE